MIEFVLIGGVVHTMDSAQPSATAIAVDDGRIVFVGSDAEARALAGDETHVLDLGGRTVIPGIVDAHIHLASSGAEQLDVQLGELVSVAQMVEAVRERAVARPGDPWVLGGGWDVSAFNDTLTAAMLDEAVADRPAFMAAVDGHQAWVNSRALAAAGITRDTPDPVGGIIVRDGAGNPSGMLRESAIDLVYDVMPEYPRWQVDTGLERAIEQALAVGLTTIIDPGADEASLAAYRKFAKEGRLHLRVRAAVPVEAPDEVRYVAKLARKYDGEHVAVNAVKLFVDGVIESETALMLEPYNDGTNGLRLFSDESIRETMKRADAAGLQLHCHAIGDGAIRQALDAVATLPPADRRPLFAHIEVIDAADLPRFAALGVYADFQPLWAYADEYIVDLTVPVIGEERSESLYPIGAVYAANGTVVAGSDWSVSTLDPFDAMEVAVTRQDPDTNEGEPLTPQHRVTIGQILRAYTADGARAVFLEDEIGTLTVGKRADFLVLDRDPLTISPYQLSDVVVLETWFEGERVYAVKPTP